WAGASAMCLRAGRDEQGAHKAPRNAAASVRPSRPVACRRGRVQTGGLCRNCCFPVVKPDSCAAGISMNWWATRRPPPCPYALTRADEFSKNGNAFPDALFRHRHKAQSQSVWLALARVEGRSRYEGHIALNGPSQQTCRVNMFRKRDPDEHAAFRRVPGSAFREMLFHGVQHVTTLTLVELADSRQVLIQKAALDGFINGHLGNRGGVQVSRLFDLNKL